MKNLNNIFILALTIFITNTFGQIPQNIPRTLGRTVKIQPQNDSTLKIIYADEIQKSHQPSPPAIFLNNSLVSQSFFDTFNPKDFEEVKIVKDTIRIDNVTYNGQIHIKTHKRYTPKSISLTALKNKYAKLKDRATIFMIDGNVISGNYDKYIIDENNLLRIFVDQIVNPKENIDLNLIKVLTKSEENLKQINTIRIRGNDTASID